MIHSCKQTLKTHKNWETERLNKNYFFGCFLDCQFSHVVDLRIWDIFFKSSLIFCWKSYFEGLGNFMTRILRRIKCKVYWSTWVYMYSLPTQPGVFRKTRIVSETLSMSQEFDLSTCLRQTFSGLIVFFLLTFFCICVNDMSEISTSGLSWQLNSYYRWQPDCNSIEMSWRFVCHASNYIVYIHLYIRLMEQSCGYFCLFALLWQKFCPKMGPKLLNA